MQGEAADTAFMWVLRGVLYGSAIVLNDDWGEIGTVHHTPLMTTLRRAPRTTLLEKMKTL